MLITPIRTIKTTKNASNKPENKDPNNIKDKDDQHSKDKDKDYFKSENKFEKLIIEH
jgi:hypothetical protein